MQQLGADDWRWWRQLRREAESAAAFSSTLAQWTSPGNTEERWHARFSNVPFNVVLRFDGAPAGMVGAYVRVDNTLELVSMWVAPLLAVMGR